MENIKLLAQEELDKVNYEISAINIEPEMIRTSVEELLCSGSKRIRTIAASLYVKAQSERVGLSEKSICTIAAGEIIHNASLLHDDVLDGAKYRRGKLSFCEKYTPHLAILTGDYLLSAATEKLLNVNNKYILNIFLKCTKEMCKSEIDQFFLRGKVPDIKNYIEICTGKTAGLFEAIIESCAILENVDVNSAKNFALNFGIFFQLKNDLTEQSIIADRENRIYTPKDIWGIEKTNDLIDNYLEKIKDNLRALPDNAYKEGLEELLISL